MAPKMITLYFGLDKPSCFLLNQNNVSLYKILKFKNLVLMTVTDGIVGGLHRITRVLSLE